MSLEHDIRILSAVPLLADFTEDKLRLLAFSAENRDFRAGQRLYSLGERADSAFVIAAGEVAITGAREDEGPLAVVGPPAILGERALIVESQRTETAVAVGAVTAILVRRPLFRRMLEEYPEVARRLHARLAGDLSSTLTALSRVRARLDALGD